MRPLFRLLAFVRPYRDNIRFGRLDASDEQIEEAARLANAHDFIAEVPKGYDSLVGERGAWFSATGPCRKRELTMR